MQTYTTLAWGVHKPRDKGKADGRKPSSGKFIQSTQVVDSSEVPENKVKGGSGASRSRKGKRKQVLSDSETPKSDDEAQANDALAGHVVVDGKVRGMTGVKVPKRRKGGSTRAPAESEVFQSFFAPNIDVDKPESSSDEEQPRKVTRPRAHTYQHQTPERQRGDELDDNGEASQGEGLGSDEDADADGDQLEDRDLAFRMTDTQVSNERINWATDFTSPVNADKTDDDEPLGVKAQTSRETLTMTRPVRPPTRKAPPSDNSTDSDNARDPPRPKRGDKIKGKKKQSKQLPSVTTKLPRGVSNTSKDPSEDNRNWLQRTEITSALVHSSTNKWTVSLKSMGPEMQAVMKLSFTLAQLHFVFRDFDDPPLTDPNQISTIVTGFDNAGINDFALQSLVKAATQKGYASENDVVDRLLYGSAKLYVDPLISYAAQRMKQYRAAVKKAAASTFPSIINLSTLSPAGLEDLGRHFIFPRNADGTWDTRQPFAGSGLGEE
ncbi:hypothetical protein DICSQDRAFT_128410 [Dichomitus squalens LYAD-421 SS1]|uniref:Uncharacterized protein n=1 Tax=Dichomitus squalens (strain LYAD-421) TaxID=732165 RepID=R7STM8_DICSQ|nr:uncharacterized protein DICSQDRAFT_128410 [Dichomitus squalens LYAD-421 SS1]EJF59253.1 hypothetical protein DICSQDRAFT_128410 [Dichomitus squalens LYAD-421 SS1]